MSCAIDRWVQRLALHIANRVCCWGESACDSMGDSAMKDMNSDNGKEISICYALDFCDQRGVEFFPPVKKGGSSTRPYTPGGGHQ